MACCRYYQEWHAWLRADASVETDWTIGKATAAAEKIQLSSEDMQFRCAMAQLESDKINSDATKTDASKKKAASKVFSTVRCTQPWQFQRDNAPDTWLK